jgi:hypothetical protein
MQQARVRASFVLAAGLAFASCGGGGGGSPPPPPPPPAAVVVANAIASATSVQEGQPFSVTGSGTTTNGMPLTFAWTQVAGPAVAIANPNTATLDLNAAEVTADTVAQFRVTATAGGQTAAATIAVTFADIAQTPVYNGGSQVLATATFTTPVRRVVGEFDYGLAGIANGPNDPLTFVDFSLSPSSQLQVAPSQLGSLPQSALMKPSSISYPGSFGGSRQISVLEEDANRFRIFTRSLTGMISTGVDLSISRPCGFSHGTVVSGSGLYIGQRTGFSVIYAGGATPVVSKTVSTGQPFCALLAPRTTIGGGPFGGTFPAYLDAVALDTDTNVLNVFSFPNAGSVGDYQLRQQVPVQLNTTAPLKLAAWAQVDPFGSITAPSAMALVFTDGVHNGEHRLVIVGFDASKNIVQQTYNLGLGVPVEVFSDNLDGDFAFPEIVVIKSTSPQAEIFEPTGGGGAVLPLGSPKYLEIGLGAASAFRTGLFGLPGMTIAFPEKKQVKVVAAAP